MTSVGTGGLATPPTTPPALSKAEILTNVLTLATQFSACVEAFNLIHPARESDHDQRVALAKLGLQQSRLLIFGDAVGISSPPATIARHMIPSHPGATNPDPNLPVNFGVRDPRLDETDTNKKIRAALDEIAGRPTHLSREELMEKYGLRSPKRFSSIEYPALDTNRLEAFREKYGLLQDLVRQMGARGGIKRGMSMTMQHWTVRDIEKFDDFVSTIKKEVDSLIDLMAVREQVDRGMKLDIRAMGWHPDLSGPVVRHDWEKLRLIREACTADYPEYVEVTDTALKYISEELKGTSLANMRASYDPPVDAAPRRKSQENGKSANSTTHESTKAKEKRPSFFNKFKSWGKSSSKVRSKSISSTSTQDDDPPRSMSADHQPIRDSEEANRLEPIRSKSLSAIPDEPAPFDLESRLTNVPSQDDGGKKEEAVGIPIRTSDDMKPLVHADTANSLIDRHDMFKGMGRVDTKDIRAKAHDWA
ncbi:hypothetical protein K491DRAFT_697440 [Lophiostoma macrostomum CBS 122681]|uniref:Prion-inhibition and propagation HeLo domain-containing protein n=1 Tax=Lophiostoma macrostomum CBS 122681 TaxID=1314788 RepID=A0A6A6STA9_9PLEO|nr:hypothetical protein K491DRAFT_697440 [Lophiostoma macrostomum CBS 122681]